MRWYTRCFYRFRIQSVLLFSISLMSLLGMGLGACGPRNGGSSARYMPILQPQAASVQVLQKMEPGCQPMGQVNGRAAGAEKGDVIWRYALNDLRNKAYAQRANVVFMDKYDHRTEKGLLHIAISGTLMQCGGGSTEPRDHSDGSDGSGNPSLAPDDGEELVPPRPDGDDDDQMTPPAL